MLGDLGADVIKIEHRVTGDPARGLEAGFDMKLGTPRQAFFETINRNKRGVVLDLGKQKGREIVYQMVEKADVFVTNFRQSAIRRYGMDYETLSKYNPKLVYGLVTGYGSKGPDVDLRSYDGLGQARSGFMTRCTADEPIYVGGGIGDAVTATMLAFGVVSALFTRERQGTGQKVETALLSTLMFEQIGDLGMHFIGGLPTVPIPRQKAMNPLVNTYRCADNRWIYLSHLEADRFWPNLCRALGIEELHNDPRFENISKRSGNEELIAILDRIFATKTRDEWLTILRENDCVFARVNTYDDLPADPQIIANDYLPEYDHPGYGRTRYPPIPVELSRTPGAIRRPAPQWGQHTEEVLTELLGYTWDQIARLKEDEVI
jgi:crotonobetainyl-CoA:carnitine CoA-transferase CaiB-like acyl-CoA transferase